MTYHQLFSEDKSHCLYCNALCDFNAGEGDIKLYFIDKYTCQNCHEVFEVHYIYGSEYHPLGFGFTCNNYLLLHKYMKNIIVVEPKDNALTIEIPFFDYSFFDKEELYQKIQTYCTFA